MLENILQHTNKNALTRFFIPKADRAVQYGVKVAPEAALAGGIIAGALAAVKFAKAYKDHEETFGGVNEYIQIARENLETARIAESEGSEYPMSSHDATVGLARTYGAYGGLFIKTYGPSALLAAVSVYLLLTSHGIMRGRNKTLLASASAIELAFREYRNRVVASEGEGADNRYFHGFRDETVVEQTVDENGKKKKNSTTRQRIGEDPSVLYSRVYDFTARDWERDRVLNLGRLKSNQQWLNDILYVRKTVVLNTVYDALGLPQSPEGCIVGWSLKKNPDSRIDFGLDAPVNQHNENEFFLDFNVDGVVFEYV